MTQLPYTQDTTLSVCIPTYNFGGFIGETLDSIVSQATSDVEILVFDGNSTDDTAAVVASRQRPGTRIRYLRASDRGGIDRDLAKVVSLASGEYCWLFSADDVMAPGAIAAILREVKSAADVYVCRHGDADKSMNIQIAAHPVLSTSEDITFNMSDDAQCKKFFELAATTEALFSFMSGLIVRRSRWESVQLNDEFVGSCWAHVARLFDLFDQGLKATFLVAVLLQRRGDNDSFATHGVVKRYALAISGFVRLGKRFFPNDPIKQHHIRRVLRAEFRLRNFLYARYCCARQPNVESADHLNSLFKTLYGGRGLASLFPFLVVRAFPIGLYAPLIAAFRPIANIGRATRAKFATALTRPAKDAS